MTLKYYLLQLTIIWFLWQMEPLLMAANPSLAKPGCNYTCGNVVAIPYPFGIGAECFLQEWFEVVCHDNRPYLRKYYEQQLGGELLLVSLDDHTIAINANNSKASVCGDDDKGVQLARNLSGSPFFYHPENKVVFVGCGGAKLSTTQSTQQSGTTIIQTTITAECTATCDRQKSVLNGCNGVKCCQLPIPLNNIQHFDLNVSNLATKNDSCGYVSFGSFPTNSFSSSYPSEDLVVVLRWAIQPWIGLDYGQFSKYCVPSGYYEGYYDCRCSECEEGNPYIPNGCQLGRSNSPQCMSKSRRKLIMLVVGGTIVGILFLATASLLLYKKIRKRRERKLKEKFFRRNGGLLLQQQMSVDQNIVDKVRLFSAIELGKATDSFNENRVLGHGGQGTVYKGMLGDGTIVAVKKSTLADQNQVDQFINEVVILSQINHRNVVKLLGCCLETDVPLLVYEFISNGTLYNLIHNETDELFMSWNMRLRIAAEIAGALAYLHSAISTPIYHRDIKSSNILLDEKYNAKVSDFGISRHITINQTHLTTMVKGTFGYLDPEYFWSHKFTEKSDVYSFGVVLVELLTGQKPISSDHSKVEGSLGLAASFVISIEEDKLNVILDNQIMDSASEKQVKAVAILAQHCLSLDGRKRPTMKEVAMELESIKISNLPSVVQANYQESKDAEIKLIFSDGISTSTTANDMTESSSSAYPLLSDTF